MCDLIYTIEKSLFDVQFVRISKSRRYDVKQGR